MGNDLELFYDNLMFDLDGPLKKGPSDTIRLKHVFPLSTEIRESAEGHDDVQIMNEVASGGQKRVYKCRLLRNGKLLALAFNHESSNLNRIESFFREAKITKLLKHPAILEVYDYGVDEIYGAYMAMPWVEGSTLQAILQKGSVERSGFPLSKGLMYFTQVCQAISFAHSQDVIHLDLKPENILIDFIEDRAFVADWGLARSFSPLGIDEVDPLLLNSERTEGVLEGTPGYMSPEQILGGVLDVRTDVYQLGSILYAILFQDDPVEGDDVEEVFAKTLAGEIYVYDLRQEILPYVGICKKAMAKNPAERYGNVRQIMNDLEGAGRIYQQDLSAKEKRRNVNLGILVSILLAILVFCTLSKWPMYNSEDGTVIDVDSQQAGFLMTQGEELDFLNAPEVEVPDYLIVSAEPSWYILLEKALNEKVCKDLGCSEEKLAKLFTMIDTRKKKR
jgi:serine/threonine protein kinase